MTGRREVLLREYETRTGVPLEPGQVDLLLRAVRSLSVRPTPGRPGCFDLRPGSDIGVIRLADLVVEIKPKRSIPMDRVMFLIGYAIDRARWDAQVAPLHADDGVMETVVPAFTAHVRQALRRGLLQGYYTCEDDLMVIRGRLRFEDQIRKHFGRFPPAAVRYDEYSTDIEANRLLKAALLRLSRLPLRSEKSRRELREAESRFVTVSHVEYHSHRLPVLRFDRLSEHYRPAVELAQLILRATSPEIGGGTAPATTFLIDMNKVFEDFVIVALREALGVTSDAFPQGARGHALYLDASSRIRLEPDISWWHGNRCLFVGDAKYKRLATDEYRNADIYQLLAYTIATDLPSGMLIYAAGEADPGTVVVASVGKQIEVTTLDLACSPEALLAQIEQLAGRIRSSATLTNIRNHE